MMDQSAGAAQRWWVSWVRPCVRCGVLEADLAQLGIDQVLPLSAPWAARPVLLWPWCSETDAEPEKPENQRHRDRLVRFMALSQNVRARL